MRLFEITIEERRYACKTEINLPISKVFDPGFTTKSMRIRTGLSLPICYTIVQGHQGEIDIQSKIGTGTIITVKLPTDLAARLS